MHILGVGLSKTGTTSLHRALEMLGFESLHYDDRRLNDILFGTCADPDFRRYDDVDAVLDIPAAFFFDEIRAAYPGCKCILTLREEDAWWDSIRSHFERVPVAAPEDDPFKWCLRHAVYGSATAHELLFRKRYREHNERVIAKIPEDRLLVLRITAGGGWDELCPFLGVPRPDAAFPHANSRFERGREPSPEISEVIRELIPAGSTFVLVDDQAFAVDSFPQCRTLPFLERDGEYSGRPENDAVAIRELERMRDAGAAYMVFASPALWWLDYYGDLERHLRESYRCLIEDQDLIVFALDA